MIIDGYLEFSDGQSVSSGDSSENVLDLGAGGDAVDHELLVAVRVFDATSEEQCVTVVTGDDEDFSEALELGALSLFRYDEAKATAAGAMRLPRGVKRYLKLVYTTVNGASVWAGLVPGDQYGWECVTQ